MKYLRNFFSFLRTNWLVFFNLLLACICFILSNGCDPIWLIGGGAFLGLAYSSIFDYFSQGRCSK